MSVEDAALVDKGEMPKSWCQDTSNKTYVYREWKENEDLLKPIIDKIFERMKELYFYFRDEDIRENADKIRFVFWFDN